MTRCPSVPVRSRARCWRTNRAHVCTTLDVSAARRNEVSIDIVQRMLDHASPEMTARYATIKDQTLRREWERFQQRINIQSELIPLDPAGSPMSDAAWALENLARAKQTLPNGYCGLPLQQHCPHPNACLTCDNFLTTSEFLPLHRDQLARTDQLIAAFQQNGNTRLVAMNEPIKVNLLRIIEGLETLDAHGERDVAWAASPGRRAQERGCRRSWLGGARRACPSRRAGHLPGGRARGPRLAPVALHAPRAARRDRTYPRHTWRPERPRRTARGALE